jgi:hypothetical protein
MYWHKKLITTYNSFSSASSSLSCIVKGGASFSFAGSLRALYFLADAASFPSPSSLAEGKFNFMVDCFVVGLIVVLVSVFLGPAVAFFPLSTDWFFLKLTL